MGTGEPLNFLSVNHLTLLDRFPERCCLRVGGWRSSGECRLKAILAKIEPPEPKPERRRRDGPAQPERRTRAAKAIKQGAVNEA
jgi:hypothetical protein